MALTPEQQRAKDLSEIKISVIDNAILVKSWPRTLSFENWEAASVAIGERIRELQAKQQEAAQ